MERNHTELHHLAKGSGCFAVADLAMRNGCRIAPSPFEIFERSLVVAAPTDTAEEDCWGSSLMPQGRPQEEVSGSGRPVRGTDPSTTKLLYLSGTISSTDDERDGTCPLSVRGMGCYELNVLFEFHGLNAAQSGEQGEISRRMGDGLDGRGVRARSFGDDFYRQGSFEVAQDRSEVIRKHLRGCEWGNGERYAVGRVVTRVIYFGRLAAEGAAKGQEDDDEEGCDSERDGLNPSRCAWRSPVFIARSCGDGAPLSRPG